MRPTFGFWVTLGLVAAGCGPFELEVPGSSDPGPQGGGDPADGGDSPSGGEPPSGGDSAGPGPGSPGNPPASPGGCSRTVQGASGNEPDGLIPVCCTPGPEERALIDEVFALLNQHRSANGRPPLVWDDALAAAIQGHVDHMAVHTFFDHEAPEAAVASPWDRARLCGGKANGENIARGQRTAPSVMDGWKRSGGHNRNMLDAGYGRVGIGYRDSTWGQIFGK